MRHVYRRTIVTVLFFFCLVSAAYAQHYYVIVGAFAIESNAQKFTGYVRSHHYNGAYEMYVAKNLFYVYVMKSTDHDQAIQLAKNLQTDSEFKGAWVFKGILGNEAEVKQLVTEITQPNTLIKDSVAETAKKIITDKPVPTEVLEPVDSAANKKTEPAIENLPVAVNEPTKVSDPVTADEIPRVIKGKLFKFAIETPDGRPLHADIHQVDYSRGRDVATFKGNQYIDVLNPMKNNPMTLVCGVFGYKEVVKEIDYTDPGVVPDVSKDEHGAWIVPYKLERMKKGDISVMYNVTFYKDAVVMLPVSKPEMDELVNMMKDNPNYKIKIHGHCNGANARRIIALGPTKNYFDVKGSNEIKGTAKELTKLRAEAVQSYLADNGIDKRRTEIYAWGALNMLVDEHSNSARLNDRIEIEITAD
jgi:outer membrane protein OmpA-like peptidoglycan-associated protein